MATDTIFNIFQNKRTDITLQTGHLVVATKKSGQSFKMGRFSTARRFGRDKLINQGAAAPLGHIRSYIEKKDWPQSFAALGGSWL
jgi:hypothetical protein